MTNNVQNFVNNEAPPQSQISNSGGSSASAQLGAGASQLASSFSTFLTLLTTQLKNQDPTSPTDTSAFTTELVQMTGVQQQLLTNQLLQQMTNTVSDSVDLIGKTVTATSTIANLTNGSATWDYTLPSAAASGDVVIKNSTGAVVFSGPLPTLTAGDNTFPWNGKGNDGTQQPDGVYTLSISASDKTGASITPTISVSGVASSIQTANGTTLVTIGSTAVPVTSITNVSSPSSNSDGSGDSGGSGGSGSSNNSNNSNNSDNSSGS